MRKAQGIVIVAGGEYLAHVPIAHRERDGRRFSKARESMRVRDESC
jgi:hypothetical protein